MSRLAVARSTRAWIETFAAPYVESAPESHALRVRGLKPVAVDYNGFAERVARSTRAWIETAAVGTSDFFAARRTLYACVD